MGISTSGILQATNDFAGFFYGSEDALLGGGGNSPYSLPNLAARYDMSNAANYKIGTGIELLSDLSGNSAVNTLALNGVVGNYAQTPNSAAINLTTGVSIVIHYYGPQYNTANDEMVFDNYDHQGSNSKGYVFSILGSSNLRIAVGASVGDVELTSSTGLLNSNLGDYFVRVDYLADNGGGAHQAIFYTSPDGVTWTKLGNTITAGTAGALGANSTNPVRIGQQNSGSYGYFLGLIKRVTVAATYGAAPVFDVDFTTVAKLATSCVESSVNAATVTINTTGDLGARICGARDLVNLTGANQPTVSGGGALFNGTSQYLQTAGFALAQPETVYLVGQQVTWMSNGYIYDGLADDSMALYGTSGTPNIRIYAGTTGVDNSGLAVATDGVATGVFNNTTSANRINRTVAATGTAGTGTPNGLSLGKRGASSFYSNIRVKEVLVYAAAHSTAQQNAIIAFLGAKWAISV